MAPPVVDPSRRPAGARGGAARALGYAAWSLTRLSRRLERESPHVGRPLAGDRDVEWAWVLAHLRAEPGRVLDLGAGRGFLSLAASLHGHEVVAVDLEEQDFAFVRPDIEYIRGDLNALDLPEASFHQVLNCSTIEHFGLAGRYGSPAEPDADQRAMTRLASLLRPEGTMVLTIPVGRDGIFAPHHRVYGAQRLPLLLERYSVLREAFFAKPGGVSRWSAVERDAALAEPSSPRYYALGLFVLAPA